MEMSYLEEIRRKGRDANPFFQLMGIELGTYGNGEAELFMPVRPDMHNGVGWLQGGLFTALCDEGHGPGPFHRPGGGSRHRYHIGEHLIFAGRQERKNQGHGKGCQKRQKHSFYGGACPVRGRHNSHRDEGLLCHYAQPAERLSDPGWTNK